MGVSFSAVKHVGLNCVEKRMFLPKSLMWDMFISAFLLNIILIQYVKILECLAVLFLWARAVLISY